MPGAFRAGHAGRCRLRVEAQFLCERIDQGDCLVVGRVSGEEQFDKRRIGSVSGGCGRAGLGVVDGHLEAQKKDGCTARTDAALRKTLQDAVERVGDSVRVKSCGYLDAMLRCRAFDPRRNAATVEVTEGRASDGWRLAGEPAGHDVMTGCVHEFFPFTGVAPLPLPTPGCFGKLVNEKRLPARFWSKFRLFRNLNPKFGQRRSLWQPQARDAAQAVCRWNCEIRIAE